MKKRVLLTGGSGFIGRHAIPLLLDKGFEVHAVFHRKVPPLLKDTSLFWHACDLLNPLDQKELMVVIKPSHLLHLAWFTAPGEYWRSFENLRWVQASIELIINFCKQEGCRVVAAGTSAEYDWSYGYCSERRTPCRPASLYGTCKKSFHDILQSFSMQTGLSYSWGRVFFLYGPREHQQRLVPSIIGSLLKNRETQCLCGDAIRDFLHVEDAASAFVTLLESDITGPINIASGNPTAIKDVAYAIADQLEKRNFLRFRDGGTMREEPKMVVAQTDRLKYECGWLPVYDLKRGMEQTIAWWKENPQNRTIEEMVT